MRRPIVVTGLALATIIGLGGLWFAHRARPVSPTVVMDAARLDQAIAYFERYLAGDPRNPMLKGQLINRLIFRFGQQADLADLTYAEDLAASALSLASDTSAGLARLSGVMLMQHKFVPAFETAQQAVAADTGSREARGTLLEAALAGGRYHVADAQAARLDPTSVSGQVRRAMWLDAQGKTEVAAELMQQACRELSGSASPSQVIAWCLTQLSGMVHTLRGPAEAERLLRRVLTIEPGYRGALEGLANLALARGDAADAVTRFRAILSNAHPDLYLRLAEACRLAGQEDSVLSAERRFVAIAGVPGNEALFGNVLALYYAERGDPAGLDSALAIAAREVTRRPTTESFDLVAWVHYRRGELAAALDATERSLIWGSPSPTMRYHRARILEALGRVEESARLLAEATAMPSLLAPHARRDWRRGSGGSAAAWPT